jgi:hypothetical protein
MYFDVRLKAVTMCLGVAFVVTPFIGSQAGTSNGDNNTKTNAFFGPRGVMFRASDLTQNKVSPTKGNNGVGNGEDPAPPGNPRVNDGPGTSPGNPGNRGGPNPHP